MNPTILIIDSDSHTKEILQNALLTERCKVVCQKSCIDAVARCVEMKPDVVMLGVTMPDMAELTILDGIRLSSPSVPVVVVSGDATADLVKKALSKGASDIILKPFSIARVLDVVKKHAQSASPIGME